MMVSNFLNHHIIRQLLVGQVDNQKRFRENLYLSVYLAAFLILELGVERA